MSDTRRMSRRRFDWIYEIRTGGWRGLWWATPKNHLRPGLYWRRFCVWPVRARVR